VHDTTGTGLDLGHIGRAYDGDRRGDHDRRDANGRKALAFCGAFCKTPHNHVPSLSLAESSQGSIGVRGRRSGHLVFLGPSLVVSRGALFLIKNI